MSNVLFHDPLWVPVDISGNAYPGALMYVYQGGTTNPVTTYQYYNGTPQQHPVIANSAGVFPAIFVPQTDSYNYRRVLKTSEDVQIRDDDNLPFPTNEANLDADNVRYSDTGTTFTGALTFSGSVGGSAFTDYMAAPADIGTTTPAGGRFTFAYTNPRIVTFSATAMVIDCSLSNVFRTTFTASVTVAPTFTNTHDGQTINWRITQDGTGSRTMTWPASFKWPGGSAGVLSTAASARDWLTATYNGDTGFWDCTLSKGFG